MFENVKTSSGSLATDLTCHSEYYIDSFLNREQLQLKRKLITSSCVEWLGNLNKPDRFNQLRLVGGVDVSFQKGDDNHACACLVVLSFPDLKVQLKEFVWTYMYIVLWSGHTCTLYYGLDIHVHCTMVWTYMYIVLWSGHTCTLYYGLDIHVHCTMVWTTTLRSVSLYISIQNIVHCCILFLLN